MAIEHKYKNVDWGNGFSTRNSILNTPYDPEVIFIGTFNHGWYWNDADFYYGRDMYMWPILSNLFLNNRNKFIVPRNNKNKIPILQDIFNICTIGKISFADIVAGTSKGVDTKILDKSVLVNDSFKWTNYSDKQLNFMGNKGWLEDNVIQISSYIKEQKSIKHIYFTFNSENWLLNKKKSIIENSDDRNCGSIFTPTGMGFRKNLKGYDNRCSSLTHCWVWNGIDNVSPINKIHYTNLDHHWLQSKDVNVNNF